MKVLTLTGPQILAIKTPENLYTGDITEAKLEYRKLSMKWHPDHDGGDNSVFAHLKGLYEVAERKLTEGSWTVPGVIKITTVDDRKFEVHYRKHHSFELGEMYVTDTVLVYLVTKDNQDLVDNSARALRGLKFANDAMKKEFKRYLPEQMLEVETESHYVRVYKKTDDVFLLRDVLDHFGGKLPSRHVAWILSSMYNLACYFRYSGISHNAISPDTYFISPKYHSGMMLGGWWYASKLGERILAVPQRTLLHASGDLLKKKLGNSKIDSQLIKTTGLEMLGDPFGSKLLMEAKKDPKSLPHPFLTWLRTPGEEDLVKEYETYKKKILVESWGPPKFFDLKLTAEDLYVL